MRKAWLLALIVLGLLAGMAATRWLTAPPPLRTANAAGEFDAVRAKARLARVLGDQSPHPADSAASDRVRNALVAELRAMGLSPRVDDRFACNNLHKQPGVACARVRNIVVTLGEMPNAPHLLVNSHYDSVPVGPGASDAGMGVAAMLETAYLLKDRKLSRSVTLLFNEGEELGLAGARAFLDGDPLKDRVDALVNLEARGTTGPVNMFETNVPNAQAIDWFSRAAPHPVASSLAVSAYRLIPNYTDVNSFAEDRRWVTLNFAPIGNETRYHSPGDNLAGQDPATLQHMGDQLLALAGSIQPGAYPAETRGERLFMTVPPLGLLVLPMSAGIAAAIGLGLLFVARVHRRRAWPAVVLILGTIIAATAAVYAALAVVGSLREGQFWRAHPVLTEGAIYATVIAVGLAALRLARRLEVRKWRVAFWLVYLLLGAALSTVASGALIYFLLAPAVFALALLAGFRSERAETWLSLLAALVLYLSLGSMVGLLQDLVNGGPLAIFGLFGGLLILPWLIEAKPLLDDLPRRAFLVGAAALVLLAWLPPALAPAYSADRQQQWTLQYVREEGKPPAWSIVNDRKPLPTDLQRIAQWRQGQLPLGKRLRWIARAPAQLGFADPRLDPVGDIALGSGRSLLFWLATGGADTVSLTIERQGALLAGGFNGRTVALKPEARVPYTVTCTGRSCDGAVVRLDLVKAPVTVQLTATHWRLPPVAAPLAAARPAFARPQYLPDATILVSRVRL
ncbi:M20/M25/M40 family metallo-hydrolase [Sphingomonas astaxanthinifaciens]|uniref:Vacuolar membrane protease n=1 Tax=Sphingomonas astaxanthinifaciens DSM 22298 TaxID=1123267 RepID=A0ABQ5Z683_9SPHN|nr:M20/M25/M40 family metallo-hydrolase [Sphingomonas astaxanthinifaciens]GLR47051.1 hypothetical protein GCM10007925_07620 [Sphingomonas astaxanthinifaciens DSM 22298]